MKKIEVDFLKNHTPNTNSNYDDIKDDINNDYFSAKRFVPKKLIVAISSFIVALLVAFSITLISVDAKEYRESLQFFEENQLSTEGLSRREIKKVYQDIKTNSFKYEKTGEVIQTSLTVKIPGYEISAIDPKLQDIEYMWDYWHRILEGKETKGKGYRTRYQTIRGDNGELISEISQVIKYDGDNIIWETDELSYDIRKLVVFDDVLMGFSFDATKDEQYFIVAINPNTGELINTIEFKNSEKTEVGINVIKNDDGSYTFISRITGGLCLMTFDLEGNILSAYKEDYTGYEINSATKYDDGLLLLASKSNRVNDHIIKTQVIIKIDKMGKKLAEYSYENDKYNYYITDIIAYNDKIYLSTYFVPKEDTENTMAIGEVPSIWEYAINNHLFDDGDLTEQFRKNYYASLLVCDHFDGKPNAFYTVKSAIGASLSINNEGKLVWNVENIEKVVFSLGTSSFTYGGTTEVYEYIFNEKGKLENIIDTNEVSIFRR